MASYCKDCVYVRPFSGFGYACDHPVVPHSIYDGSAYQNIEVARGETGKCGPDAKLYVNAAAKKATEDAQKAADAKALADQKKPVPPTPIVNP